MISWDELWGVDANGWIAAWLNREDAADVNGYWAREANGFEDASEPL